MRHDAPTTPPPNDAPTTPQRRPNDAHFIIDERISITQSNQIDHFNHWGSLQEEGEARRWEEKEKEKEKEEEEEEETSLWYANQLEHFHWLLRLVSLNQTLP